MSLKHVEEVVKIHAESWSPNEISVKLGKPYLEFFYRSVVGSPHSFGYVYTDNGHVVGYATGFYDYRRFNAEMKKARVRLGSIVLLRLMTLTLSIKDLQTMFKDEEKLRKLKFSDHHLGALALAPGFKGTPVGKTAITASINAVIDEIRTKGFGGVWGVCDERNVPMQKYLQKLGFADVDVVSYAGKKTVVFEKSFADSVH